MTSVAPSVVHYRSYPGDSGKGTLILPEDVQYIRIRFILRAARMQTLVAVNSVHYYIVIRLVILLGSVPCDEYYHNLPEHCY